MIDLRQIEYFVACARTGSFSKAAEILFTTQSNVSKVIHGLEAELEESLFERYAKGVRLTPRGEQVYEHSRQILENLEKIAEKEELEEKQLLRISANPSSWFADQFVRFYQKHQTEPLHYEIYSADSQEIVSRVHERIDDAGFVYVMKNQLPAFTYFLSRNYLEFEPIAETVITVYVGQKDQQKTVEREILPGRKAETDPGGRGEIPGDQELRLSDLKLIQRYSDEFSPDNYWEITDESGGSAAKAETVITTNSDYIMERILDIGELSNISCAYLSGEPWRKVCDGITLPGESSLVLFGLVKRQNEELPFWAKKFTEHLKEKE